MLPVFLDLKFVKIYTFGIFLVLSFFWGTFLLWKNFRLTAYKEEDIFDCLFIALTGGLIGARLTYVALNYQDFHLNILKMILINGYPGLVLWGGIIGGLLFLYLYIARKKMKFLDVIDYFISPLFLALAFGKLGSFFAGNEVGTKTNFFLSLKYVGFSGFRHLTAFYESILFFIASYIAYQLLFEIRRERYHKGYSLYFFLFYTSLVFFLFDKIKANHIYLLGQSFNTVFSILLLVFSGIYFLVGWRNTLFTKINFITNFIHTNGKKTRQAVHHGTEEKVGDSQSSVNSADQSVKKG